MVCVGVPFSLGGGLHSLDGLFKIFHRNRQRLQRFGSEGPDLTQRSAAHAKNGLKKRGLSETVKRKEKKKGLRRVSPLLLLLALDFGQRESAPGHQGCARVGGGRNVHRVTSANKKQNNEETGGEFSLPPFACEGAKRTLVQ
jgi:hypothetical protein